MPRRKRATLHEQTPAPAQKAAKQPAKRAKKVGKTDLRHALDAYGGIIAQVATHFSVERQTVYNWLDDYDLRDYVNVARRGMFEVAADNVYEAVMRGDLDISKFVLTHMPGGTARWSSKTEITGKDGEPLMISPDVRDALREMGIELSEAVREFEEMVRQQRVKAQ